MTRRLVNHPIEGPIFSGPQQVPFVCKTIQAGLGEPLVDNQDGEGFRVLGPGGVTAGWSRDCSAATRVDRFIYSFAMLADPAAGDTDSSRWSRRLACFFDAGVAIGRNQGAPGGSALNPDLLGRGYAIAHSSGTRISVHYNTAAQRARSRR